MNELSNLQQQINEALKLLQESKLVDSNNQNDATQKPSTAELFFTEPSSLLERCEQICSQYETLKPTIRIIHHFACSGGTLISKCISAQPNVFLLSELHPTTRLGIQENKPSYTPRDLITQAFYSQIPDFDLLAESLFLRGIIETEKHVRQRGGVLVIRAHTHADYCTQSPTPLIDTITRLLMPYFDLKHLVTVRNPIDSFLSLRKNGWIHFSPNNFDEYCRRLLVFIKSFEKEHIYKYEDFVSNPSEELEKYTDTLNIQRSPLALEYFDQFKVSGDSGRSGSEIEKRSRRKIEEHELKEFFDSPNFAKVREELSYEI